MATEAQIYAFCLLLFPFSLIPFPFCEAGTSTTVERPLQIRPFMQNKPNFRKAKMNLSAVNTKDYERNDIFAVPENKANSNPIKANTKPIKANKNQIKAKTNPIQSQFPKSPK